MSDIKISELAPAPGITGREIFVCARDAQNWSVLLERIRGRFIFPEDFGAKGDGESDDGPALAGAAQAALDQGKPLVLAGGTFRIGADLGIAAPIHFLSARLAIDAGARVALAGEIHAGREQIFVGRLAAPLNASEVLPEWFGAKGAPYDAAELPDDTEAVQAAIDAAAGGVLRLSALYAVRPDRLTLRTANSGLHLLGHTGGAMKGPGGGKGQHLINRPTGFLLKSDGDWMFRFGSTEPDERGCNQIVIEDVIFDGNHRTCRLGLIWAQALTQSKLDRITVRNTRGPGVFANKLEDVNITNSQFGKLGDAENVWNFRGAVVFGAPPKYAGIGSNVIFFHACRFEWFDGGCFRAVKEPAADSSYSYNTNSMPYVHHLILNQCKIEVGDTTEDGETYGDTRNQWAVFEFGDAVNGAREDNRPRWVNNIMITSCHLNGIHHARTFARVGSVENFSVRGNNFTFSRFVQNPQSLLELMDNDGGEVDCRTLSFKDNGAWVKGGADDFSFQIKDLSRYEILFEPPLISKLKAR